MSYLLYFLALLLIYFSVSSLRGGLRYLDFFKRELAKPESDFTPFVSIIAPCRGLDDDLKGNLRALYSQNYPAYEIVFVVEDQQDAAVPLIETTWKSVATSAVSRLVVAGQASDTGQKVHNLRRAVLEVSEQSEVFVFVDSDARVGKNWLRNLVAPLADNRVGAATGYRWFVSKKGHFASDLRSIWNASIASALGNDVRSNFCWGGSTAIRRRVFEGIKMRERWRGTVSDDFAVTRAVRENNLQIRFVPQCLIASVEDCTFDELLEFTTRQMTITRVYAEHLWRSALFGSLLFTLSFYGLIVLSVWQIVFGGWFWLSFALLLAIFALGAGKAHLRLEAVKMVLKKYENEINQNRWRHILMFPLAPPLYLYNSLRAAFSTRIVWRGIAYELKSASRTIILSPRRLPEKSAKDE